MIRYLSNLTAMELGCALTGHLSIVSFVLQGSNLTVASSKCVTSKSHLPSVKNVDSKKLLPGSSVLKVISSKIKLIFTKITLLFYKTKHNAIWSKALLMPLTLWNFV